MLHMIQEGVNDLKHVNVKVAQGSIYKMITWKKNLGKYKIKVGKGMCREWLVAPYILDTNENKICK